MSVKYPYHSLEDLLAAQMQTVDGAVDDGWGATYPVKGLPPKRYRDPDGTITEASHGWQFLPPRSAAMKNLGAVQVRHIVNRAFWAPR